MPELTALGSQTTSHLIWTASDLEENHASIAAWLADAGENVRGPVLLDVDQPWPTLDADVVFTANTLHIVSLAQVCRMIAQVAAQLPPEGLFLAYGPFNYNGAFTSESNARFELWLKNRNPLSGIRDFERVCAEAEKGAMVLKHDHEMPANNRLLVFRKEG